MAKDRESLLVRPTIPMTYLREMVARSRAPVSVRRDALLAAGVSADALKKKALRISALQFERFHRALSRAVDDEAFGFFARPVPPGSYATLVRLLTGCADVTSCFDACARFYALFDRRAPWTFATSRASAVLRVVLDDRERCASAFFVHSMLLVPWRTAMWLTGRALVLDEVQLPHALASLASEARFLFGREARFADGPPALRFRAEVARMAIVRRPTEVDEYARTSLLRILGEPPLGAIVSDVRALLSTAPHDTVEMVARKLGRSRASFARDLQRAGTNFQQIKDDLRRDHAIDLLTSTSLTIAEVAERVGYSEPSAFQRAFRDWTGVAPGKLRAARR